MYRLIYAFDHLPLAAVNCSAQYLGPVGKYYLLNSSGGRLDLMNKGRNWLACTANPSTGDRVFWFDLRDMGIVFEKRVIIGYNWWCGTYASDPVRMGLSPTSAGSSVISVNSTELFIYPYGYIEVVLDFDALTTTVFVNGVQKVFRQNTQAKQNQIATQLATVAFPSQTHSSDPTGVCVTDFYVRDSVGETDPIKPLGVAVITPITLETVTADGFTPATGNTLVGTLNAKVTPAAVQPEITAPDALVDATVSAVLKVTPIAGRYPAAFQLFAQSKGQKSGAVVDLKLSGITVPAAGKDVLPLAAATSYVSKLGIFHTTQDDVAFTWGKVNESTISIKYT